LECLTSPGTEEYAHLLQILEWDSLELCQIFFPLKKGRNPALQLVPVFSFLCVQYCTHFWFCLHFLSRCFSQPL